MQKQTQTHTVTILTFVGCPNDRPAADTVRRIADRLGIEAHIEHVRVTDNDDAARLRFLGSPTIQVNGVDIEPAARSRTDFALCCRTYESNSGVPAEHLLIDALRNPPHPAPYRAQADDRNTADTPPQPTTPNKQGRGTLPAAAGAVGAAALATVCCWLPPAALAVGASAAPAVSSRLHEYRPIFLATAAAALSYGFFSAYRPTPACCKASAASRTARRAAMWTALALAIALTSATW